MLAGTTLHARSHISPRQRGHRLSAPAAPLRSVPTLSGAPLLGNAQEVSRDVMAAFSRAFAEHSDLVRSKIGTGTLYLASHPELAQ